MPLSGRTLMPMCGCGPGLGAGQPVQTNLPVTVPVSEAPENGVAEISQLTGPGAVCFATVKVSLPKGVVNVASMLAGMNSAVLPSLVLAKAGLRPDLAARPPSRGRAAARPLVG